MDGMLVRMRKRRRGRMMPEACHGGKRELCPERGRIASERSEPSEHDSSVQSPMAETRTVSPLIRCH